MAAGAANFGRGCPWGFGWVGPPSPAYADVTTASYNIGAPTPAVNRALLSPPTIATVGTVAQFRAQFVATAELAHRARSRSAIDRGNSVVVTTSKSANNRFGGYVPRACSGQRGQLRRWVDGHAREWLQCKRRGHCDPGPHRHGAPPSSGSLTFDITTSGNATPAVSNPVTRQHCATRGCGCLSGAGANTTYTIADVPVTGLSAGGTSPGGGSPKPTGGSGYSCLVQRPLRLHGYLRCLGGGATTTDAVTAATLSTTANPSDTVTLDLLTSLASGYIVNITAEAPTPTAVSSDDFTVTVGNATAETTSNDLIYGSTVRTYSCGLPSVAGDIRQPMQ